MSPTHVASERFHFLFSLFRFPSFSRRFNACATLQTELSEKARTIETSPKDASQKTRYFTPEI